MELEIGARLWSIGWGVIGLVLIVRWWHYRASARR